MRSGLHISLLLLLLLVLLAQQPGCRAEEGAASDGDADAEVVAAGQEQRTEVEGKEPSTVPAEFIVSNATLRSVLQRVASPKEQAVIFTTTGCVAVAFALMQDCAGPSPHSAEHTSTTEAAPPTPILLRNPARTQAAPVPRCPAGDAL